MKYRYPVTLQLPENSNKEVSAGKQKKGKTNMSNVLILSCKPILKKEEEEALARDNVQLTQLANYSQDISKNINSDYDYILLDNALGSTDIYQVRRVGNISGN